MMSVDAGVLNRRVTMQRKRSVLDGYGHQTEGWDDVVTVWARIRPISTAERLRAGAIGASMTHEVTTRWHPAIRSPIDVSAWRIKYGDRIFAIESPRDIEESHQMLIFTCIEGSIDGS